MTVEQDEAVDENVIAIKALISDLRWQIDRMHPRGIKDAAGNPYDPAHYKRGLQKAINRGGLAVAEFVRGFLQKPPSVNYRKLQESDSLDLACEALVRDENAPYAHLFTDAERELARKRLAPHQAAIDERIAAQHARIQKRREELPSELSELTALAATASDTEEMIAINQAILQQNPTDVVALNRIGRGYEAAGFDAEAIKAFEQVLELDPGNNVAKRRLNDMVRAY